MLKQVPGIKVIVACVLLAAQSFSSHAALITYTGVADWRNNVSNDSLYDFNSNRAKAFSLGENNYFDYSINVAAYGSNAHNWNGIWPGYTGFNIDGSHYATFEYNHSNATSIVSINFARAITTFAADWLSTTSTGKLTMSANGSTINFADHLQGRGNGFLGFVSDTSFTEITFGLSGVKTTEFFSIDNMRFGGTANAGTANIGEPAAIWLMLLAILALVICRRRNSNSSRDKTPSD